MSSVAFLKVPGRCAWTQPDCVTLQNLVDTLNHPDVDLLQTEICQGIDYILSFIEFPLDDLISSSFLFLAFATLTPPVYPSELHCPSGGYQPIDGDIKIVNRDQEELNAASGWSTCGGDVTIKRDPLNPNGWYQV